MNEKESRFLNVRLFIIYLIYLNLYLTRKRGLPYTEIVKTVKRFFKNITNRNKSKANQISHD